MRNFSHFKTEPYRFLFLIGLGHLGWGLMLWVLFYFNLIVYPGAEHARSMIEGFLLSFSLGFLMTALPRFSNTTPSTSIEAAAAAVLGILSGFFDFAALATILFLLIFAARRNIFSAKVKKPPFFLFVQGGLIFGLVGLLIKCFEPALFFQFKSWLYEGMIFLWLCGIGSRILVMLLDSDSDLMARKETRILFAFMFTAILMQPFHPVLSQVGDGMRLAGLLYLSARVWQLQKLPFKKGALAWGVWLGLISFNMGQAVKTLFPSQSIHAVHLIFVSGYCVLALMVAVRVSIAHSGDPIELERKLPQVIIAALLIVFAGVTRYSAGFMSGTQSYLDHLLYAAVAVILAIPFWAMVVISRLGKQEGAG